MNVTRMQWSDTGIINSALADDRRRKAVKKTREIFIEFINNLGK